MKQVIYVLSFKGLNTMSVKVLIVDDSVFAIATIRKVLENMPDFEVVGEALDGRSAYKKAKTLEPDLITLDNILPDTIGTKLIKPLKKINPEGKILIVSAIQQASVTKEALELGADGYLVKPFRDDELKEQLQAIGLSINY